MTRLRSETQLLSDTMQEFSHGKTRLFRNTVGSGYVGPHVYGGGGSILITKPSRITFGLGTGTSDLIGWQSVTVTPGMVGRTIAQFVSVEGKSETGRVTPEQTAFIATVRTAGGLAGVFRSTDDVRRILAGDIL